MKKKGILILLICGVYAITSFTNGFTKQQRSIESFVGFKINDFFPAAHSYLYSLNTEENFKLVEETKSGVITRLPWEKDEDFQRLLLANGSPSLMAAYQTVLKDPMPGEEYNVHLAAKMLAGTIIKPNQIFSQNNTVGPYVESKGFRKGPTYIGSKLTTTIGGGVCKIASTLYNVSILSNMEIVERHQHSMPVPYVPYGQDATVSYGAKDFKFRNINPEPIMIWAQGIDNVLYIAFYGKTSPPIVDWHHEILGSIKAPKEYISNNNLEKGTERVVLEGMDGVTVRSWITIKSSDGTEIVKKLGISDYKPMAFIIERGSTK